MGQPLIERGVCHQYQKADRSPAQVIRQRDTKTCGRELADQSGHPRDRHEVSCPLPADHVA
ncbi:MAG: hypothetical protein ITD37_05920 [Nitrosospira sp.]|nr:hypothetical protein [Nitrosospira sp.]